MRKVFKYIFRILLGVILLVGLGVILLYLPPVQRFVKNKAVTYAAKKLDMQVQVGNLALKFPLDLTLEEVYVGKTVRDTFAYIGKLHLDVGLKRIFRKELAVKELALNRVKFRLQNDTTGMELSVGLDTLELKADRIDLKNKEINVQELRVATGDIFLRGGKGNEEKDTTAATPFDWKFYLEGLELSQISYNMETPTLPLLSARLERGMISKGEVDIGKQEIDVQTVAVAEGECRIQTAASETVPETVAEELTDTTSLWTVKAARVEVKNYAFTLSESSGQHFELNLSNIGIQIDSVYNRGSVVMADLKQLQVIRKEGGRIEQMQARVDLEPAYTEAGNVYVRTPYSSLRLNAFSEAPLSGIIRQSPLKVKLDASVGMEDIRLLWKDLPPEIVGKKLSIQTEFAYSENRIDLKRLRTSMAGFFDLQGKGQFSSIRDLQNISGNFVLKGELKDIAFVKHVTGGNFEIPPDIQLDMEVSALRGELSPHIEICRNVGCLVVAGNYSIPALTYDLHLQADRFDIAPFLPADSLGILTADIRLVGKGIELKEAESRLSVEIGQLTYKRHAYRDIQLIAGVDRMKWKGELKSEDPDLILQLAFQADSLDKRYVLGLEGEVGMVNLKELNMFQDDFSLSMKVKADAAIEKEDSYLLNVGLDQVRIDDGRGFYNLGGLLLHLLSDRRETHVDLVSGDFHMTFRADTLITQLPPMFAAVAAEVKQQIQQREFDMVKIQALLPFFRLKINGSTENVMGKYLQSKGILFKEIALAVSSTPAEGFHLKSGILHPVLDKVELDSIVLNIDQRGEQLTYRLQALNPQGIVKDLYNVQASGYIRQDRVEVEICQKNKQNQTGVHIGADLILRDSSYVISLFPENPVLGYTSWMINAGNRIIIGPGGRITADLRIVYQEKLVSIQSLEDRGAEKERLQIEINGIDLAALTKVIPFIPDLSGKLNTDLLFYSLEDHVIADGDLSIGDFYYQKQRIGDVGLNVFYDAANRFTNHAVNFSLYLDEIQRVIAKGKFSTSEQNRDVEIDLSIPSLPLYLVNAFVPADVVKLSGDLNGKVELRGTLDRPQLNGGLAFQNGQAEAVMLGTAFGLDSTLIPIRDGKLSFRNFAFTAPNRQALLVNGELTLTPFSDMRMDMNFKATNFQVVNVKKNPVSLLYGKAYADVGVSLKGPFTALNLTGGINLLNNTSINYVIKSSTPQLKDRSIELVRFVSFRDTTLLQKDLLTNRVNNSSFMMKLFIEIGSAVNVVINLSEDGDNQVAIQGGGNLIYSMNPEGGNNLVGKYTLSGGMVRYAIPVVGEKNFNIRSGSYVEWTGPLENPSLYITASESVKVSVSEDNQSSRLVNFDAIIRIEGNLNQPQITFDLSAPNDQAIQTQLAAFSAEERTKQAMNLLIYGTYSGPGTVNTGNSANNTLNNFVEKELNQWSRKYLKNAGLTFGIDSYNQIGAGGQEVKKTDVSYQFSKQLFNDKINVKIGGRVTTDNDPATGMEQNLVDDIAIEYMFSKNRNWFLKIFRHTNYESVLEGEVTQTGFGIVLRKSFRKIKDLFIRKSKRIIRDNQRKNKHDGEM